MSLRRAFRPQSSVALLVSAGRCIAAVTRPNLDLAVNTVVVIGSRTPPAYIVVCVLVGDPRSVRYIALAVRVGCAHLTVGNSLPLAVGRLHVENIADLGDTAAVADIAVPPQYIAARPEKFLVPVPEDFPHLEAEPALENFDLARRSHNSDLAALSLDPGLEVQIAVLDELQPVQDLGELSKPLLRFVEWVS